MHRISQVIRGEDEHKHKKNTTIIVAAQLIELVETIRHITAWMISTESYKMYAYGDLRFVYLPLASFLTGVQFPIH